VRPVEVALDARREVADVRDPLAQVFVLHAVEACRQVLEDAFRRGGRLESGVNGLVDPLAKRVVVQQHELHTEYERRFVGLPVAQPLLHFQQLLARRLQRLGQSRLFRFDVLRLARRNRNVRAQVGDRARDDACGTTGALYTPHRVRVEIGILFRAIVRRERKQARVLHDRCDLAGDGGERAHLVLREAARLVHLDGECADRGAAYAQRNA